MELDPVTVSIVGNTTPANQPSAPAIASGTVAKTPAGQPNLLVNVVPPLVAILVRFANAFFTTFLGLITAAGIGVAATPIGADFGTVLGGAALASLVVAGVEAVKSLVTIFGNLESKYPLLTGSI